MGKAQPIEVSAEPVRLALVANLEANGEIVLSLSRPVPKESVIQGGGGAWMFHDNEFQEVFLPPAARGLLDGSARITRDQIPLFLSQDWPQLAEKCEVRSNFKLEEFELATASPSIALDLAGGLAHLEAKLHFDYGGKRVTAGTPSQKESVWMADPANPRRYGTRDLQAEQAALALLFRAGFTGPHEGGVLQLAGQNAVLSFFARDYQRLLRQWKVTLEERLERSTAKNLERIEPSFAVTPSGQQWFDLDVAYKSTSGERFSTADIQRLILSGQSHARLKNGKFAIIDTGAVEELLEVILDCSPRQQEGSYRISNTQAGFLASALKENATWQVQAPAAWREKALQHSGSGHARSATWKSRGGASTVSKAGRRLARLFAEK
jgi:hypothetical protein